VPFSKLPPSLRAFFAPCGVKQGTCRRGSGATASQAKKGHTMADNVDTTDTVEDLVSDFGPNPDNDPMLREAIEAEKEIAGGTTDTPAAEGENPEAATAEGGASSKAPAKEPPIMIPKARLDEVVAKLNRAQSHNDYLQGVVTTQKEMIKAPAGNQSPSNGQTGPATTETAPTDYDTLISNAETEKLALAQKYEDGEITLVELRKQEISIDRNIRKLDTDRLNEISEGAKAAAVETVSANNVGQVINSEALKVQELHPYVAEIDKLPEAIAKGIWQAIADEAFLNLTQKGINPNDGSVTSRVAYIKEKAALTDKYGPQYTGKTLSQPKPTLSLQAQQREAKLDLAQTQPPAVTGATGERAEITEADLMKMSDDQVADLIEKNPNLANKLAGSLK